jgi:hypothetical protein
MNPGCGLKSTQNSRRRGLTREESKEGFTAVRWSSICQSERLSGLSNLNRRSKVREFIFAQPPALQTQRISILSSFWMISAMNELTSRNIPVRCRESFPSGFCQNRSKCVRPLPPAKWPGREFLFGTGYRSLARKCLLFTRILFCQRRRVPLPMFSCCYLPCRSRAGNLIAVCQGFQKRDEISFFLVRQPKISKLFLVESVNVSVVIVLLLSSAPASPRRRGAS